MAGVLSWPPKYSTAEVRNKWKYPTLLRRYGHVQRTKKD